jgi:hypothetical protein
MSNWLGLCGKHKGNMGTAIAVTPTPDPPPTPTPTPTPSAVTHNNTTPADLPYTVTNFNELKLAINDRLAGINLGVPIVMRGPAEGSAAGAYDDPSGYLQWNPGDGSFASQVTIRSAKIGTDKAIWRGPVGGVNVGWIYLPGRSLIQGVNIVERNNSATNDTYTNSYYSLGNMTYDRCYLQGMRNVSDGFGTTAKTRFMRAIVSNMVLQNSVVDGFNSAMYADAGASGISLIGNSFLHFGDHILQTGSVSSVTVRGNIFQEPEPGYTGGEYYSHGGGMYVGGINSDTVHDWDIDNNFLLSPTDQKHSYLVSFQWEADGDGGGAGVPPSPTNAYNILIRRNITRGVGNTIVINGVAGTGNQVYGNDVRRVTPTSESSISQISAGNSVFAYHDNVATIAASGGSVDQSLNNNTAGGDITAAAALAELELWAAGGNLAGITMQTISTLGLS